MTSTAEKKLPLVVIFGRTNVGKSTLFNCLTESRRALTSEIAGTTRDANRAVVNWRGRDFELCDTGGIIDLGRFEGRQKKFTLRAENENEIQAKIEEQAKKILAGADLILFLVDNKIGLTADDRRMIGAVRRMMPAKQKRLLLVANKVDSRSQAARSKVFLGLGLGAPALVSAATGSGTGDLLDLILEKLSGKKAANLGKPAEDATREPEAAPEIKILIVGKPNVGKSSLLNKILGEERVIVSPIPHTTREPQDALITYRGKHYRLIDSAGISRSGQQKVFKDKQSDRLIKYGIAKTLGRLHEADLAILVIDASQPLTHQDAHIADEIVSSGRGLLIAANKWDLVADQDAKKFANYLYGKLPFIAWAPIQATSALTGAKVDKLLALAEKINDQSAISLADKEAENFLKKMVKLHKPAKGKGVKHPRLYEFKQVAVRPPRFSVRIGAKDDLHFSYLRFMMNRLRDKYGFIGTPIFIEVEKNKRVHGRAD